MSVGLSGSCSDECLGAVEFEGCGSHLSSAVFKSLKGNLSGIRLRLSIPMKSRFRIRSAMQVFSIFVSIVIWFLSSR